MTSSPDEKRTKIEVANAAKVEDSTDAGSEVSGALWLENVSAFQVLKLAIREHFFPRNTSLNELENLHKLEMDFPLHQKANLVLAEPSTLFAVRWFMPALLKPFLERENRKRCEIFEQRDGRRSARPHFLVPI